MGCWDIDQVVSLDFSSNPNLISLECDSNIALEFVNVQNGNNQNLETFWADNSPNLQCIEVDDEVYANNQTCGGAISWCKDNSTVYSEDCSPLSIGDFNLNLTHVYPNPTKDHIEINSNLTLQNFEIYDMSGKQFMNGKLEASVISLAELHSGIYFIKLKSQEKEIIKKIIKE